MDALGGNTFGQAIMPLILGPRNWTMLQNLAAKRKLQQSMQDFSNAEVERTGGQIQQRTRMEDLQGRVAPSEELYADEVNQGPAAPTAADLYRIPTVAESQQRQDYARALPSLAEANPSASPWLMQDYMRTSGATGNPEPYTFRVAGNQLVRGHQGTGEVSFQTIPQDPTEDTPKLANVRDAIEMAKIGAMIEEIRKTSPNFTYSTQIGSGTASYGLPPREPTTNYPRILGQSGNAIYQIDAPGEKAHWVQAPDQAGEEPTTIVERLDPTDPNSPLVVRSAMPKRRR